MDLQLSFFDDPASFLSVTADHLRADPVLNTVLATVAERDRSERRAGITPRPDDWYLVIRDDQDETGTVLGVGMRTAPFSPSPIYLLPMPDGAALELARVLHDRGEPVAAVNGALPAAAVFADESARLSGQRVEVGTHTRLFELRQVIDPAPVRGGLRLARDRDAPLVLQWLAAFHHDADAQAGRTPSVAEPEERPEPIRRKIEAGLIWLWTDEVGQVVHLTGGNRASFGAQRIGPVYTPAAHRGHGYASAAVAEVSRGYLAAGARPCLFTDQANPTSNRIYRAIGYEPVVDMINLRITR